MIRDNTHVVQCQIKSFCSFGRRVKCGICSDSLEHGRHEYFAATPGEIWSQKGSQYKYLAQKVVPRTFSQVGPVSDVFLPQICLPDRPWFGESRFHDDPPVVFFILLVNSVLSREEVIARLRSDG